MPGRGLRHIGGLARHGGTAVRAEGGSGLQRLAAVRAVVHAVASHAISDRKFDRHAGALAGTTAHGGGLLNHKSHGDGRQRMPCSGLWIRRPKVRILPPQPNLAGTPAGCGRCLGRRRCCGPSWVADPGRRATTVQWAPDSSDKWAPDLGARHEWALDSPAGPLTLGAAVEHFLTAKAAEGASPKTIEW